MRKFWQFTLMFLALLPLLLVNGQANAQTTKTATPPKDPESVYRAEEAAQNAGDVETAMSFYADDAVGIAQPPPPDTNGIFVDKAAIRKFRTGFMARHPQIAFTDFHTNGDTVSFTALVTEDVFRDVGIFPVEFSGTAVIQGGLIRSEAWHMRPDVLARFELAIPLQSNKATVHRIYDELWNKGNLAAANEIYDANVVDPHADKKGVDAIKQTVTLMRKAFPDLKVTVDNIVAEGDLVITGITFDYGAYKGGLKDTLNIPDSAIGKKSVLHSVAYARFKDDKIVEVWDTHDQADWLQQFGFTLAPPK
ncbi:MAG: nuclear transport factor 2 family protein [Caldilineaceae bacterium]